MSTHEIVVGLDDSRSARAALRWVSDSADPSLDEKRRIPGLSDQNGPASPRANWLAPRTANSAHALRAAPRPYGGGGLD